MTLRTDICIVGAGPAGATAALFLAKLGIPHLIVDAATFPRDKVCGDGLDLKVMRILHHLDPDIPQKILREHADFVPSWGARFITPNGQYTDLTYRPEPKQPNAPLYWVSKRKQFDQFLVERFDPTYTDFRQNTPIRTLRREDEWWHIDAVSDGQPLTIMSRLVIGADGDHSVVLRELGERKIERQHYAASQRQYWKGISDTHTDGLIEFYFPARLPWSYFWIFPLPNGEANVGFIMLSDVVADQKINVRQELQRLITEDPFIAPRFKNATPIEKPLGWGLPLATRQRKPFGDGYLLVGDAASLICPLTGEGIGTSMLSGYLAAQFAQKAVAAQQFDAHFLKGYERELYRRLSTEIRTANALRFARYVPWSWCAWALNTLLPSRLLGYAFRKMAAGWLNTAFYKKITILPASLPVE